MRPPPRNRPYQLRQRGITARLGSPARTRAPIRASAPGQPGRHAPIGPNQPPHRASLRRTHGGFQQPPVCPHPPTAHHATSNYPTSSRGQAPSGGDHACSPQTVRATHLSAPPVPVPLPARQCGSGNLDSTAPATGIEQVPDCHPPDVPQWPVVTPQHHAVGWESGHRPPQTRLSDPRRPSDHPPRRYPRPRSIHAFWHSEYRRTPPTRPTVSLLSVTTRYNSHPAILSLGRHKHPGDLLPPVRPRPSIMPLTSERVTSPRHPRHCPLSSAIWRANTA